MPEHEDSAKSGEHGERPDAVDSTYIHVAPGTDWKLDKWLKSIGFDDYVGNFKKEGYDRLESVMELKEDDLVAIGVKKGHLKIIIGNLPRLKPKAGKRGRRPKGEVKIQTKPMMPYVYPPLGIPMARPPLAPVPPGARGPPPPGGPYYGPPPHGFQPLPRPGAPGWRPPGPGMPPPSAMRPVAPAKPGSPGPSRPPTLAPGALPPPMSMQPPSTHMPMPTGMPVAEAKRGRGRPRKNPAEPPLKKLAQAGPEGRPVPVNKGEEKEKKKRGRKPKPTETIAAINANRRESAIAPLPPRAYMGGPSPGYMPLPPQGASSWGPPPPGPHSAPYQGQGKPLSSASNASMYQGGPPPPGPLSSGSMMMHGPPGPRPQPQPPGPAWGWADPSKLQGFPRPMGPPGQGPMQRPPPPPGAGYPLPGLPVPPRASAPKASKKAKAEAGAGKEGLTPTKRKADGAAATPSKTGKTPDKAAAAPEPKAKGSEKSAKAADGPKKEKVAAADDKPAKGKGKKAAKESAPAAEDSSDEEYVCSLCGLEENHPVLGELDGPYEKDRDGNDIWVHENCVLWSPEFYTENNEPQNLAKIVNRGKSTKCTHCQKKGGTIGCRHSTCKKTFHYLCIEESGGGRRDNDYFVYCADHKYKLDEEADKKASKKAPAKPPAKATPPKAKAAAQSTPPAAKRRSTPTAAPASASKSSGTPARRESSRLSRTSSRVSGR